MARSPALLSAVVRILCAEISRLLRRLGQERGVRQGATGMVVTIQNPHAHLLVLDGVYHNDGHRAVFTETRAPTQSEIAEVTGRVQARVLRELKRRYQRREWVRRTCALENQPLLLDFALYFAFCADQIATAPQDKLDAARSKFAQNCQGFVPPGMWSDRGRSIGFRCCSDP